MLAAVNLERSPIDISNANQVKRIMQVEVLYFASLREQVGCNRESLTVAEDSRVQDVWRAGRGTMTIPANLLCAINEEYAALDAPVSDGDQVAFFPPVTGG
jgi:molybdopterin synthase sulfur carrier subunit